jgi:hypothetical protein
MVVTQAGRGYTVTLSDAEQATLSRWAAESVGQLTPAAKLQAVLERELMQKADSYTEADSRNVRAKIAAADPEKRAALARKLAELDALLTE